MNQRPSKSHAIHRGSSHRGRLPSRVRAFGWATVAVASLLLAAPQQALAQQPAAAASASPQRVTLITGDRVIASGPDLESVRIERGPGREGMRFTMQRRAVAPGKPHLFVLPADAAQLVQAGKVDRRLFDVTLLVESGYDDARRNSLPLIVTYPRTNSARTLPRVVPGTVAGRDLPSVNGQALSSPKAQVSQLWSAVVAGPAAFAATSEPIGKVWLDALHHPVLDQSVPRIGAPAAWELGYEGDGVVVAVLDTGVDEAHPDLIDTVVVSENFTIDPDGDQVGHGTHVASIIAGSGAASGGLYRGVAPGVSLLSGKVCEGFGCPESSMIAGMQWAAAEEGAQVINMSISGTDTPGLDPLEETVETLSSQFGTLFVISAGNDGGSYPVGSAGSTAAALTVGAVDRADNLADFSSRGLTVDGALKPDITGPGVDIVAARGAGTELGALVGEDYVALSGTSMAAPHVAGAAALVLQQHPTWRGADIKAALMGSAAYNPTYTTADQGAGRVDVAAAIGTRFLANAASLSLGTARWPHEDDEPTVRTVTYRNLGPATELELELDIVAADGTRPPAEMFMVTPSSISLPEGGTASVRVTANTSVPAPDGLYSGRVLASDASGWSLAIPLALVREVESYDLTVRHLDRGGQPTAQWFANLFPYAGAIGIPWVEPPSTFPQDVVLRLPKGKYAFESYIFTDEAPDFPLARMLAPNQLLDADKLLVLDASAAVPIDLIRPAEGAENLGTVEFWGVQSEEGGISSGLLSGTTGDIAFYRGEIEPPEPTLLSESGTEWVVSTTTPPEFYAGAWTEKGGLPPSRLEIDTEQAAVVNAHYAAPLTSLELVHEITAPIYGIPELGWATFVHEYELPLTRTERYFSPDPAMRWVNDLWMHDAEFSKSIILGWVAYGYPAGETSSASWNEPVFSPALPEESLLGDWGWRDGDVLTFNLPMYGDRGGHGGFIGAEGTSKLYRGGELVGEYEYPDGGQYEVGSTVTVPLLAVRFTPELDEQGRAPSGTRFCLPLSVDQFERQTPPQVEKPSVEASYDDGATWVTARVEPNGSGWNAFLDHPRRAQYVSLRTSTHDATGNAVEQTIYRAYGLKTRH
jgi:subtilisin family serine protease